MKFQNHSLIFFGTDGRMHARTHKPKPICSPLFKVGCIIIQSGNVAPGLETPTT